MGLEVALAMPKWLLCSAGKYYSLFVCFPHTCDKYLQLSALFLPMAQYRIHCTVHWQEQQTVTGNTYQAIQMDGNKQSNRERRSWNTVEQRNHKTC